jgi:hypothetical protein
MGSGIREQGTGEYNPALSSLFPPFLLSSSPPFLLYSWIPMPLDNDLKIELLDQLEAAGLAVYDFRSDGSMVWCFLPSANEMEKAREIAEAFHNRSTLAPVPRSPATFPRLHLEP